ncbi:MAG: hypothetical protein M3470_10290 [Chloroflexota bacterium]|nr:hypothetical protein [Chloroflexota bacterium]
MFEPITQRTSKQPARAPGETPTPEMLEAVARWKLGPTVLEAECTCPESCLRDHENE